MLGDGIAWRTRSDPSFLMFPNSTVECCGIQERAARLVLAMESVDKIGDRKLLSGGILTCGKGFSTLDEKAGRQPREERMNWCRTLVNPSAAIFNLELNGKL